MKKSELIAKIAESTGQTKKVTEEVLNSAIDEIIEAVKSGDSVEFLGFGKFERKLQKGREGRVPGTDKTYKTDDKFVPTFKVGKVFKDKVANS